MDETLANADNNGQLAAFNECIAIEDPEICFQSATSAGLKIVITLNEYTNKENFKGALVVLDHLGEDDQPFSDS